MSITYGNVNMKLYKFITCWFPRIYLKSLVGACALQYHASPVVVVRLPFVFMSCSCTICLFLFRHLFIVLLSNLVYLERADFNFSFSIVFPTMKLAACLALTLFSVGDVLSIADEIDDDTSAKRAHATLFLVLFSLGCTTCLNSRHLIVF